MTKKKDSAEKAIRDIRRATRRQYSAEEKIRIVLEGLQGSFKIAPGEFLFVSSMRLTLRARLAVQGSFKIAPGDFVNFLRRFDSSSQ